MSVLLHVFNYFFPFRNFPLGLTQLLRGVRSVSRPAVSFCQAYGEQGLVVYEVFCRIHRAS